MLNDGSDLTIFRFYPTEFDAENEEGDSDLWWAFAGTEDTESNEVEIDPEEDAAMALAAAGASLLVASLI